MNYKYQPLILLGAARSGTKLVREFIAAHPVVDCVPFDVNYIWRLGNESVPHDELPVELLTARIRERILREFDAYHSTAPFLVEKSVSNCLRVPYVHAVFPDARFIHLMRNGYDVVESVYRQWISPPEWRTVLKKAKSFPLTKAFGYALAYVNNTCLRLMTSDEKKRGIWGPRYIGIDQDVGSKDLLKVCAIQWARCIKKSLSDLSSLPAEQVLTICYEGFVQEPLRHLEMVAHFAGFDPDPYSKKLALDTISEENIGKGFVNLSPEERASILPVIQETLEYIKVGSNANIYEYHENFLFGI